MGKEEFKVQRKLGTETRRDGPHFHSPYAQMFKPMPFLEYENRM